MRARLRYRSFMPQAQCVGCATAPTPSSEYPWTRNCMVGARDLVSVAAAFGVNGSDPAREGDGHARRAGSCAWRPQSLIVGRTA